MKIKVKYINTLPDKILVTVIPSQVEQPMFGDFDPEYADNWERAKKLEVGCDD